MKLIIPVLTVLQLISLAGCIEDSFNLYIAESEINKLMGLFGDLYYVRDGDIQENALKFNIPVPVKVDKLHFTWYTNDPMFYALAAVSGNPLILRQPYTNISSEGGVPTTKSVFTVNLSCTGAKTADIDVIIQLNVTLYSAINITVLNLRRTKACLRDPSVPAYNMGMGTEIESPTSRPVARKQDSSTNNITHSGDKQYSLSVKSTSVFYIAIGVACGLILMIVIMMVAYHVNTFKDTDGPGEVSNYEALNQPDSNTVTSLQIDGAGKLPPAILEHNPPSYDSLSRPHSHHHGSSAATAITPVQIDTTINMWTHLQPIAVERDAVTLGDVLYEGTFGKIHQGLLVGRTDKVEHEVFIKTINDQASEEQIIIFLQESCMLEAHENRHLLSITAVNLDDRSHPLVMFPYMNNGNLKVFLRSQKENHHLIASRDLVSIAIQITKAMQYLARRRLVHRDLATRNCVVDDDFNVKLTDNALSRDLFPQDYHCLGDNENRPVKWLAPESLVDKIFSPSSDVWSFGVTLWELMTLANQPYPDIDPFEIAPYLKDGYRLHQPTNCPDELYKVMAYCWAYSAEERPKFTQLSLCLNELYKKLGAYI